MAEAVSATPSAILRLDEAVVNRIAAGEVIQRPANALKEMIENSLDAKSSNIQVTVRDGGLKLMQIQDNGNGIRRDDMEIVCERFTTSKIRSFDDLNSVATYGFRGEALASISHVAHVTIVTRTADAKCAFRGSYCDGKLKEPVKPCAGNVGTQISVEDLYYNVPTRRKALRSPAEEHQKIIDVVSRYAIHNAGVGFMLKKHGDSNSDVKTPAGSTPVDNIRIIYGPAVARELLDVSIEDSKLCFELSGLISNANYNVKRAVFLLFINMRRQINLAKDLFMSMGSTDWLSIIPVMYNFVEDCVLYETSDRLVDSTTLRKAIELVYATYLPKNTHPFIYLNLKIAAQNIDVNVHPTKHEVHFLHEEAIVEHVQKAVDSRLLGSNSSRTFYMKTLMPIVSVADDIFSTENTAKNKASTETGKLYAHQVIRTDSREQKLDAFFAPLSSTSSSSANVVTDCARSSQTMLSDEEPKVDDTIDDTIEVIQDNKRSKLSAIGSSVESSPVTTTAVRREVKLTSVQQLKQSIESNMLEGLRAIFQNHTFVGCITSEFALLQHDTLLYLSNTTKISKELFYQLIIFNFGNFGFMRLSEPASIYELALLALDSPESGWKAEDGPKDELAKFVVQLLSSKAEMLADYFSIEIDEKGNLLSLPLIIEKYLPFIAGLPMYILRLATEVEWDDEKSCFETFAQETAEFFALKSKWIPSDDEDDDNEESFECKDPTSWKWMVEHVIYPSSRLSLFPPKQFADNGTLLQIANMTELYKVFERC